LTESQAELQPFFNALDKILLSSIGQEIREQELIALLQSDHYRLLQQGPLTDPLLLFQTHFLLYHCLYVLQHKYRQQQICELDIGLARVEVLPYRLNQADICCQQNLRDYYLDWRHFSDTKQVDVEHMLQVFWNKMLTWQQGVEDRPQALALLSLPLDATRTQIKKRYRQLLHQHHPDKQQSNNSIVDIIQAYQLLKSHF